ncbi:hypothetical protein [Robiginitalea sediminis]|uniref:hypothetical protein n=1 Tax=Robiginitalea sediminis TaxID=1982593 RepID=UPI00117B0D54|nr:hypothetical protein [Robiginitalea sediminis]
MGKIPRPVIHLYDEVSPGKFATVRHFQLCETVSKPPALSPHLNIAENRSFAKSNPVYWVKERIGSVWSKKALTGIWKAPVDGFFYGDSNRRQNLLLFQFVGEHLRVYFFRDYYTRDISSVIQSLAGTSGHGLRN